MGRAALRSARTLVVVLATVGMPSMPSAADAPEGPKRLRGEGTAASRAGIQEMQAPGDVHFAVCPCWLTPKELVEEIEQLHSDISFECYLTAGSFSMELSAYSSGVGGPFQSEVSTPQQRSFSDSRCRHLQVRPRVNVSASETLRTTTQRAACISILTKAAAQLGCKD